MSCCVCGVVQVLGEDLKLVLGQQDRLERGSDTWANPVSYDKLGEWLCCTHAFSTASDAQLETVVFA